MSLNDAIKPIDLLLF